MPVSWAGDAGGSLEVSLAIALAVLKSSAKLQSIIPLQTGASGARGWQRFIAQSSRHVCRATALAPLSASRQQDCHWPCYPTSLPSQLF